MYGFKIVAMKIFLFLCLTVILCVACNEEKDKGLSEDERKTKLQQLANAENELRWIDIDIAKVSAQLKEATGGTAEVLRIQMEELMHQRGEVYRKVQNLKRELGIKTAYNFRSLWLRATTDVLPAVA